MSFNSKQTIFTGTELDYEEIVEIPEGYEKAEPYFSKLCLVELCNLLPKQKSVELAEKALKKDTGARALRAIIEEFMLDIMYEIPKDDNIGHVIITRDYIEGTGGPVIKIRSE